MESFWNGRRVFITGHTGFKGSWLCCWLKMLGAKVVGYGLAPPTEPNLFDLAKIHDGMTSILGDVRDFEGIKNALKMHCPEIIIHLAAQSLVRQSYEAPRETYSTNVMGTVNLLDAIRQVPGIKAVVNVTSDKCYDNREWIWGYRENDPLGGADPYSSSKGCAELITSAYRHSFFSPVNYGEHGVALASARAGNVIGGGDYSKDRLIPDIMVGFLQNRTVRIRYPEAIRPWQFVLEPLSGYLILAEKLYNQGTEYAEAWNFGPPSQSMRSVKWIVEKVINLWGADVSCTFDQNILSREALLLRLDSSKAQVKLGWNSVLGLKEALEWTVAWYQEFRINPAQIPGFTRQQVSRYMRLSQ